MLLSNEIYKENGAMIYCHKSSRKNAKVSDCLTAYHLINHNEDRRVSDDRILTQLTNTFEGILSECKDFNKHIEISVFLTLNHQVLYTDDSELKHSKDYFSFRRQKFNTPQELLIFLCRIFRLIYPYATLSTSTVFDNPSIKYILNEWYEI